MDKVRSECKSPSAAVDVIEGVALDETGEHVALSLAAVTIVSGRALRNIKVVDVAGGDIVDKAMNIDGLE